jgi:hypothetical protein
MLETMYNNSRRMEMAVEWRMILENTENSNGAVVELVEGNSYLSSKSSSSPCSLVFGFLYALTY